MRKIWSSREHLVQLIVQLARALQVRAKRLLDDDVDPLPLSFDLRHLVLCEPLRDVGKVLRRHRQIEQPVALRPILLVEIGKKRLQLLEALIVIEVGREVLHAIHERLQRGVAAIHAAALQDAFLHVRRERRREIAPRHAHDGELLRQQMLLLQVKQRRQQLALGQIARRTKDHHDARLRNSLFLQPAIELLALRAATVQLPLPWWP